MAIRRRRGGRGRPSLGERARKKLVTVKFTPAEYDAIGAKVDETNALAPDRKPITVARWIRDAALAPIGAVADSKQQEERSDESSSG